MRNKELELHNKQFLINKEWWIEETDKEYILFVKHNGKTYQSKVDKDDIDFAKGVDNMTLKEGWITLLTNAIEIEILKDSVSELEKKLNG